jgi:hypothetical protein
MDATKLMWNLWRQPPAKSEDGTLPIQPDKKDSVTQGKESVKRRKEVWTDDPELVEEILEQERSLEK